MSLEPICVCECEDCGDFLVGYAEFISAFLVDDDIYILTVCPYCDRITKNTCDLEMAEYLFDLGVKVFNWNDGESFIRDE